MEFITELLLLLSDDKSMSDTNFSPHFRKDDHFVVAIAELG
jgi:hypothetical protein